MEHYKNMILANAAITNQIYLTTENKDGLMSMKRRDFTDEMKFHYDFEIFLAIAAIVAVVVVIVKILFLLLK